MEASRRGASSVGTTRTFSPRSADFSAQFIRGGGTK
jgi:hypothetical protein